jgi:hypothetical protein
LRRVDILATVASLLNGKQIQFVDGIYCELTGIGLQVEMRCDAVFVFFAW